MNNNIEIDKVANNILTKLSEWKENANANFVKYAHQIYASKIQNRYSSLLTPCPKGVFLKVTDIGYNNDSEYIDLYQELQISRPNYQGSLFSMLDTSLMPFDVQRVRKLSDDTIKLTFCNNDKTFTLANQKLVFWIHSDTDNIKQSLQIFNNLKKKAKLTYYSSSVEGYLEVNLELGYQYKQKINLAIKNNIYDPRLQFTVSIDFSQIKEISFEKIDLELKFNTLSAPEYELTKCFHTNIIPMINQAIVNITPFKLDGNDDIYWLKTDTELKYQACELRGLYSNNHLMDPSTYRVIYSGNQIGIEFNQIEEYFNTNITGSMYIDYNLDDSLYATDTSLRWYGHNINKYKINAISSIYNKSTNVDEIKIRALISLLDISELTSWTIDMWKHLLAFFDKFAYIKISYLLNRVDVKERDIVLNFITDDIVIQKWITFYVYQLKLFISHNVPYLDVKLQASF
ncbi:hypothetical protein IB642_01255 [Allofrancisella guangzhouensis]|uniref:Uncharacterized protein n=1 Tax=Allofrancisella guangzhouensis TaxID=594679 RepID=A0A0A8E5C7_9GAMM|nr:type VI secretion system baseplate subunit TssF/IglH [Allofrancisella guangzhouensis]AJC49430.1 hypothetical protein SD28_07270 [Allofrancisella guangzhouensis]MBK2026721.1 hypothetical protein [Allofrancisella guangzhouensis]MBK2043646.1 hypothetical protein [Allofrancisella guangzhouensis]MBK2046199.1 hypothetical protein [Allofrancisella guangzhouensis]